MPKQWIAVSLSAVLAAGVGTGALRADDPPAAAAAPDLHVGAIHFKIEQSDSQEGHNGGAISRATVRTKLDVIFPVRYTLQDEGEKALFRLIWKSMSDNKPPKGTFSSHTQSEDNSSTQSLTADFDLDQKAEPTPGTSTSGEIVVAPAGKRPYLQVQASCITRGAGKLHTHTKDSDVDRSTDVWSMIPMGVADDGYLEEAPLRSSKLPPASMPDLRRQVIEGLSPQLKLAAEKARSSFDAKEFRDKWKEAKPFTIPAEYSYTYAADEAHDQITKKETLTSTTTFELELGVKSETAPDAKPVAKDPSGK